ncbi:MAG: FAD-dependent oxidoreductase [Nitrosarchaeum sp.]|nr:FAD-dependent oxidoreductase [Nitrosarchaeum sp.]
MVLRVVVVGAGYAGVAAARVLVGGGVRVHLVDPRGVFEDAERYPEVVSGKVLPRAISRRVSAMVLGVRVHKAAAVGIDRERKEVLLSGKKRLAYDYCLLAVGHRPSRSDVPGLSAYASVVDSARSAHSVAEHMRHMFRSFRSFDGVRRKAALTCVIAGSSRVACELAASLMDLLSALGRKHKVGADEPFVYLLVKGERVAPELPEREGRFLLEELERKE